MFIRCIPRYMVLNIHWIFFYMQESLEKEIPTHNDPFHNHISEFWKFISKSHLFHNI
jgi:hypothetical protein